MQQNYYISCFISLYLHYELDSDVYIGTCGSTRTMCECLHVNGC